MRSLAANALHDVHGLLDTHPSIPHQHHLNDLHSLHHDLHTSHLHNLDTVPVSVSAMSNIYFPAFQDTTLSMHMNHYSYPLSEGPMDIQYILGANMGLPQHLLVDENTQHVPNATHVEQPSPLQQSLEYSSETPPAQSPAEDHSPVQTHSQSPECRSRNGSFSILTSAVQTNGHAHTMLPPMVHPNSSDSMSFDADTRSFNQRINHSTPVKADPYAAGFLQDQLGEDKWNIFSARLFERRLSGTKSKSRNKSKPPGSDSEKGGATAIDFLVKVEVVKEILRKYVPHPYNPLKSLAHPYEPSPAGYVTLTRSTVLSLSGWSNTQFSYWARRAEAISVLAPHDDRLSSVANSLEQRLRGESDIPPDTDSSSSPPSATSNDNAHVTGKGLDIIIDEVKKRTGASQFLRGKHSSLDPFGSTADGENGTDGSGGNAAPLPAPVYTPTFQALEYTHSPPPNIPSSDRGQQPYQRRRRGRKASIAESMHSQQSSGSRLDDGSSIAEDDSINHLSFSLSDSRAFEHDYEGGLPSSPEIYSLPPSPMQTTFVTTVGTNARPRRTARTKAAQHKAKNSVDSSHPHSRELFPVSDSRSELENVPQKRSRDSSESPPKKRIRQSEAVL